MNHLRELPRVVSDLVSFCLRSGRPWLLVVVVLLLSAGMLAVAAAHAVPVAVYTLF